MECPVRAIPWVMVIASSPEGGLVPHVHLPGIHPIPRKGSEGESVETPAFPGHWQDWVLLPIGNPHHRTMGGKSEAPCEGVLPSHLSAVCGTWLQDCWLSGWQLCHYREAGLGVALTA